MGQCFGAVDSDIHKEAAVGGEIRELFPVTAKDGPELC